MGVFGGGAYSGIAWFKCRAVDVAAINAGSGMPGQHIAIGNSGSPFPQTNVGGAIIWRALLAVMVSAPFDFQRPATAGSIVRAGGLSRAGHVCQVIFQFLGCGFTPQTHIAVADANKRSVAA